MKICKECKIEKDLTSFNKQIKGKGGYRSTCISCRKHEYLDKKDYILQKRKEYYDLHRDRINTIRNNRLKNDVNFKLRDRLRNRLYHAIKNGQKIGSAVNDLGCSIEKLKIYLESLFQEGMTWENWSYYGWHVDHKIPLSSFNLNNREEFLKACHYTNLQPMWRVENQQKSDKTVIIVNSREITNS
jgi:hypothetical protein